MGAPRLTPEHDDRLRHARNEKGTHGSEAAAGHGFSSLAVLRCKTDACLQRLPAFSREPQQSPTVSNKCSARAGPLVPSS